MERLGEDIKSYPNEGEEIIIPESAPSGQHVTLVLRAIQILSDQVGRIAEELSRLEEAVAGLTGRVGRLEGMVEQTERNSESLYRRRIALFVGLGSVVGLLHFILGKAGEILGW